MTGLLAAGALAAGCVRSPEVPDGAVLVPEAWTTVAEEAMNVDSVATWRGTAGEHWLFATAKEGHLLRLYDADSGRWIRDFGGPGSSEGEFLRPNGIAVVDDLLFVVERDNRRVQGLRLPDLEPLGVFGAGQLTRPYGLWIHRLGTDRYRVYVTDNYETPDGGIPQPADLGRRVHVWELTLGRGSAGQPTGLAPRWAGAFGETSGTGILHVVESVWGDPRYDRLLVAEEDEAFREDTRVAKVYDLAGRYTGHMVGAGRFTGQPEGIALNACPDGRGYWILTDQGKRRNVFQLFDRATLEYAGGFVGPETLNTDGIWFGAEASDAFPQGALYAVHDDQAVSAFDWRDIAASLGLAGCD